MTFSISLAAVLLVSYLAGSIPFGFVIGKCHGVDIRKEGSGNIGATNVTRVIGPWWGKLCFLLDFLKGFLASGAVILLTGSGTFSDPAGILPVAAALAVVLGHIYPVYLKFKGGKGISTAAGAVFPLCPLAVLIALAVWIALFLTTRYVSVASIAAATVLPAAAVILYLFKRPGATDSLPVVVLFILLGALAILKHISNIKRLLNGTENRFSKGGKQ